MSDPIRDLARQLEDVVESKKLVTDRHYGNAIAEIFNSESVLQLSRQPSGCRELFVGYIDLWKQLLAWFEEAWVTNGRLAPRNQIARAMENILHNLDEDVGAQIGFFEATERILQLDRSSDDLTILYGVFGSWGEPAVKQRLAAVLLQYAPTVARFGFELVCDRHATKPWAWALAADFSQHLSLEEREKIALRSFNHSRNGQGTSLPKEGFLKLVGEPESAEGREFLMGLGRGS